MREIAAEMGVSPAFVCRALKVRQRLPAPFFGDGSVSERERAERIKRLLPNRPTMGELTVLPLCRTASAAII